MDQTERADRARRSIVRNVALCCVLAGANSPACAAEYGRRTPVAICVSANGQWAFTANRDSGTVSVINVLQRKMHGEVHAGSRLTDVTFANPQQLLLVLANATHELIVLQHTKSGWAEAARTTVPLDPVRVVWDEAAERCHVASLWARRVTTIEVSMRDNKLDIRAIAESPLPFEPRELCLGPDGHLIVAGAFSARMAVINTDNFAIIAHHRLRGHNMRGMALQSQRLLVAQQVLNPLARSSRDDVHWGNMMENMIAAFPIDVITQPSDDIDDDRVAYRLSEPGKTGAADPSSIAIHRDVVSVLLSGVHHVAIGNLTGDAPPTLVPIGKRPISSAMTSRGELCVANMFSDSVSIIDVEVAQEQARIRLSPGSEKTARQRGEELFFDASLSHDGWMSCHSCHTDGHANGQTNDNLSDGSFGTPKRVLSLLGIADTKPWAWNGKLHTLHEQVVNSVEKTMQGERPHVEQVEALVAFLSSLKTAPPLVADSSETSPLRRGQQLFDSLACQRCHVPPTYTSAKTYDVGLHDRGGNRQFNPPSLRGVARRESFFHDGRAGSLRDVFAKHHHQIDADLSSEELESLLQFLTTL